MAAGTSSTTRSPQPPTAAVGDPRAVARSVWKGLLFRLAAMMLGLLPLLAGELALRGLGLGKPTDSNDPYVGFSDIHPLFVLNQDAGRYEIPRSRQTHFQPESFAAAKPAGEYRIFVLGGSTVQGRPWSIETSFTTWLELHLSASDPSHHYEVVNCGGVSYATYRLVPVLQEVLKYQPDLIIFCEGHNEFLEDRSYASVKHAPAALAWPQRQVSRLRTYNVLRDGVLRLTGQMDEAPPKERAILGPEVDARLDWQGGLDQYRRDDKWQADVTRHFDFNLRRVVTIAENAGVPLIVVSPVSNLEWAPFKSEHRVGITPHQRDQFEALLHEASELYASDMPRALGLLQLAAEIDDQHAQVHYEIGTCLLELGRKQEAQEALVRAKDLDVCPLRILEPMERIIHEVARETGTPLVDADALIAAHSRSGFPDRQWLVDHVHPKIEGHQLIADAIAARMAELGHVSPAAGWEEARDRAYRQHLESLTHAYFERGKQRLRSEQGWAHGRVRKVRGK